MIKKIVFPLLCVVATVVLVWKVSADSTITIPVPEKSVSTKQVTLSFKIPPNYEPITQKTPKPRLSSKSSLILWDPNPNPKISKNDEFMAITQKFMKKGWVKGHAAQALLSAPPINKFHAVRIIQHIKDNILEIAQSPNMYRTIRKSNLTSSDIEDLRKMIMRFQTELVSYGENVKRIDKDLLMLQEQYKTAKSGVLKVIKVEGAEDGGTVVHLSVE
ncbi:MAG: hypothetical protein HQM10_19385 [Candidatus Riflebacteria bacterium]|nr:hypothetical protein [Candidatus Riflebacteria bacterium]